MHHVSQWAGVDVGVMNAAVFSVSVFPVGRTFVMLTEQPSCLSVDYGTEHMYTPDQDKYRFRLSRMFRSKTSVK